MVGGWFPVLRQDIVSVSLVGAAPHRFLRQDIVSVDFRGAGDSLGKWFRMRVDEWSACVCLFRYYWYSIVVVASLATGVAGAVVAGRLFWAVRGPGWEVCTSFRERLFSFFR